MTIEERLDRIKQRLKNKRGVFSIVTGQRMLPVAGAAVDSKELLTKDDFCNAFLHTALTRGLQDFNSFVSPAAGMEKIIDYSKKGVGKMLNSAAGRGSYLRTRRRTGMPGVSEIRV